MPYKDPKKHAECHKRWLAKGNNREGRRLYAQRYHAEHKEELRAKGRKYALRIKLETLAHYGGSCACCGETEPTFLSIDHIEGGGTKHRKALRTGGGHTFYRWLRKNGYPKEFQILCMNCQFGKAILGICPHQKLKVVAA